MRLVFIVIFTALSTHACDVQSSTKSNSDQNSEPNIYELIISETKKWNLANNERDVAILSGLYSDSVLYYRTLLPKNSCIENKLTFFRSNKDFYQRIDHSNIEIVQIDSITYKATFVKSVTLNGKTKDYPSYLVFDVQDGSIYLSEESDLVTDKNVSLSRTKEVSLEENLSESPVTSRVSPRTLESSAKVINGNIFYTNTDGSAKQITHSNSDEYPLLLPNAKVLFFRRQQLMELEGGLNPYSSIESYKIMEVDVVTLKERVISDRKPFQDGLDGSKRLLYVFNPVISLNGKYVLFSCEYAATGYGIAKVNIASGRWEEVFAGHLLELIVRGPFKGALLGCRSEIRDRGRDSYCYVFSDKGKVLKEFGSEDAMNEFRKTYGE